MKKYSVVLGSFDGVHAGHKKVISLAAQSGDATVAAVYFLVPPAPDGNAKELITNESQRRRLFKTAGVKKLIALQFDEVRQLSPEAFFRFLRDAFNPQVICCGFNYRFGKNAAGDTNTLKRLCDKAGIELRVAEPVTADGITVSSSAVREYIKSGDMKHAGLMLGRPFSFEGQVQKGDGRGKSFGFPTANTAYPDELIKPKAGVYISRVWVKNKCYNAVTNLGGRPTYPADNPPAETYILDKCGNLYGKQIKTELFEYIREQKKFESAEELKTAIASDVCAAKRFFENKANTDF